MINICYSVYGLNNTSTIFFLFFCLCTYVVLQQLYQLAFSFFS